MKTWGPGNSGDPTQEGGERTSQDIVKINLRTTATILDWSTSTKRSWEE